MYGHLIGEVPIVFNGREAELHAEIRFFRGLDQISKNFLLNFDRIGFEVFNLGETLLEQPAH